MQLFVLSNHCKARVHCGTCRNKEGGRSWREDAMKRYAVPNNEVDFACPYGHAWGYKAPHVSRAPRVAHQHHITPRIVRQQTTAVPATPVAQQSSCGRCSRKKKNA